jgi:hypothetical protein
MLVSCLILCALQILSISLASKLLVASEVCFSVFCIEFEDMSELSPYKMSLSLSQWVINNCCQIEETESGVCLVANTILPKGTEEECSFMVFKINS